MTSPVIALLGLFVLIGWLAYLGVRSPEQPEYDENKSEPKNKVE